MPWLRTKPISPSMMQLPKPRAALASSGNTACNRGPCACAAWPCHPPRALTQRHLGTIPNKFGALDHLGQAEFEPFLQLLDARLVPFSVLSLLVGLLAAARAMARGGDFPILEAAIRPYKRTAKPTSDKQSRMRTVHELQDPASLQHEQHAKRPARCRRRWAFGFFL